MTEGHIKLRKRNPSHTQQSDATSLCRGVYEIFPLLGCYAK